MARPPLRPTAPDTLRRPRARLPRRAVTTLTLGAVAIALLGLVLSCGSVTPAGAATTSTTSTTATTTPTTTPATITPTTAPATTAPTTTPATTTPTTAPAATTPTTTGGVPSVPVGSGSSSATTAPGTPAPNAGPSVALVDADLDQLQAIASVSQAHQTVAVAQANLASANAALAAAKSAQARASQGVTAAQGTLNTSTDRLADIAVAAYTGAAYGTPEAAPAGDPGQPPDAQQSANIQEDAAELMSLVTQQVKQNLKAARQQVGSATTVLGQAATGVARASAAAQQASDDLAGAQANLAQTIKGATVSGAAYANQAAATGSTSTTSPSTSTTSTTKASAGSPTTGSAASGSTGSAADQSPTILGAPYVSAAELAGWYLSTSHQANTTVPIQQLAADYMSAAKATGVRGDLAFAQSIIETGYFSFPAGGQLVSTDNNFAGIGACDSCSHGWSFPDALTGVTAQEELLEAYASPTTVATPLVGPVGIGGCCQTWIALAGKWATDIQYGISIMTVYKQILDYAIPEALVQAGLKPAGSAPPLPAIPTVPASALPAALPAGPSTPSAARAPTLAAAGT